MRKKNVFKIVVFGFKPKHNEENIQMYIHNQRFWNPRLLIMVTDDANSLVSLENRNTEWFLKLEIKEGNSFC